MTTIVKQKHILIIDDDNIIIESYKKQLKTLDYKLEYISNPIIAMDMIKNNKYDLILCDIKMEPIDGLEVLRRIKNYNNKIPVIIISGYADDSLIDKAREYGCEDFLIKPVRKAVLVKKIISTIERFG